MLLAYWTILARYVGFMSVVVSALSNRNLTLPTIQPRTLCNCFEFTKEVTLRFPIHVSENPAVGHSVLLVIGQQRTQFSRERDMTFLVILRKEADIRLAIAAHC